jgi:hypothetical protein
MDRQFRAKALLGCDETTGTGVEGSVPARILWTRSSPIGQNQVKVMAWVAPGSGRRLGRVVATTTTYPQTRALPETADRRAHLPQPDVVGPSSNADSSQFVGRLRCRRSARAQPAEKVLPWPTTLSTATMPPWASTCVWLRQGPGQSTLMELSGTRVSCSARQTGDRVFRPYRRRCLPPQANIASTGCSRIVMMRRAAGERWHLTGSCKESA